MRRVTEDKHRTLALDQTCFFSADPGWRVFLHLDILKASVPSIRISLPRLAFFLSSTLFI